jgi:hypothetical protein
VGTHRGGASGRTHASGSTSASGVCHELVRTGRTTREGWTQNRAPRPRPRCDRWCRVGEGVQRDTRCVAPCVGGGIRRGVWRVQKPERTAIRGRGYASD